MDALTALLGPDPDGATGPPGVRSLLVQGDVVVHLHESPAGDELALSSTPGQLSWALWPHHAEDPWWESRAHPQVPGARCALRLDPHSRSLHLIERWPRHALDPVALGSELLAHAQRHRAWRQRLRPPEAASAEPRAAWRGDFA